MGLEIVELIMRVEEEFGLEIPDANAEKLVTVGLIEDYLVRHLDLPEEKRDAIWQRLQFIVSDQLSIEIEKIRRDSRLVEDLGID